MRAANLWLWEGGCIFLCLFTTRRRSKKRGRWTCSPIYKPVSRRSLSMFPAMSTAPGNTTACVFPMANGAGFPVGSAVTARWTTSSKSRAVLSWRQWRPLPAGLPPRRRPLRPFQGKKNRSTCFCRRPPQTTRLCWTTSKAVGFPWRCWTSASRPGAFMRAGIRAMEMWCSSALTKPEKRGLAACEGSARAGSTGI